MNRFRSWQIKQKTKNECRDEKIYWSTVYTGSLIKSYIQFHLTPRWNTLKPIPNSYNTAVLETYKNNTNKTEKPYFSTPSTPRNPIKEWLTLTPFTRKSKGKITPERRCKNSKSVVQLLQNCTGTFTKIKVFLKQAHLKIPLENLSKTLFNPSSHTENV